MSKKGFTLLEVIVVMGVLSIIGVIILTIFTRTLKGNNKAQILVAIKQNGQSVLENMSQAIRNAHYIVCMDTNTNPSGTTSPNNSTVVIEKNGVYTRYRIALPSDRTGPMPSCQSNGCIISDNPVKEIDEDTGKEETESVLVNRICPAQSTMTSAQTLTDTNPQSGVSIMGGSFTTLAEDSVTINFILGPGVGAHSSVTGQIDAVNFETTVQLR